MNDLIRTAQIQSFPQSLNWCDGSVPPFPCPPPGFPPPGCFPWFSGHNSPPWYPGANAGVSFGTPGNFPMNAVRGHFFWDGTTLWMFDGAVWVATGGGGGGTPPMANPPANPVPGQQWFNGSTLFVWDGNAWVPVSQTKTFVQTTAPAAPNPGDLWWDGVQMRIWDGSAWELVGPGATVGPVPTTTNVFKLVDPTASVGGGGSVMSIVPFSATPAIDTLGGWDSITKRYTPKRAGNYLVFGMMYADIPAGEYATLAVIKNDSGTWSSNAQDAVAITSFGAGASPVASWVDISGARPMNGTTDFLRMWGSGVVSGLGGQTPNINIILLP